MWDFFMNLLLLCELIIVCGGVIFMHSITTEIKGRIYRPTIPFVVVMAMGWLLIPELPSIDDPNVMIKVLAQFGIVSLLFFTSCALTLVLIAKFGEKPKDRSVPAWPWN
jgi:hypothetical protein